MNKDGSIRQLTEWAHNESVSPEDLDRGIKVAMGCEAIARGGNRSGQKVKFAEMFAKAEEMSESERAKLTASVAEKRKAVKDAGKAYGRRKRIAVS